MSPVRVCLLLFVVGIVLCVVGLAWFVRRWGTPWELPDLLISGFCVLGLLVLVPMSVGAVRTDEKTCTITEHPPPEDAEHSATVVTEQCGELVLLGEDVDRLRIGHTYRLRVWGVFGSGFVESIEGEVPR